MDTHLVEALGRNRLIEELLRAEFDVALPFYDRGVDLIAYKDRGVEGCHFAARPIQMKAFSKAGFSLFRYHARIHDLIMAYVWHVDDAANRLTYALTYREAVTVFKEMGYTKTKSWKRKGYTNTQPGKKLCGLMEGYRMDTAAAWRSLMTRT